LRRAIQYFPYRNQLITDYGQALLKMSLDMDAENERREATLREACAAIHLGELVGDLRAGKLGAKCLEAMSSPEEASWQMLMKRVDAVREADAQPVQSAVDECSADTHATGKGVAVTVDESEISDGSLSMETLLKAYISMVLCGVVALSGAVFSADFVEVLANEQRRVLSEYFEQLQAGKLAKEQHTFARERGAKRFEVRAPLAPPFSDDQLIANPIVLQLIRLLLGSRVEIDTLSQVSALPGAADQSWHTDVEGLFREPEPGAIGHHPPAGLVMVVPLVNLTEEMGPTEFQTGSHRLQELTDPLERKFAAWSLPIVRPLLDAGSVVLFDLRLTHRGTQNIADTHRPILYMSYVKEWWVDIRNFQAKQSEDFDAMSPLQKKLLKRLDHRTFVERLTDFAEGRREKPPEQCSPFQENDLQI